MKTKYKFPLDLDRSVLLELPVPLEQLGKRERKKIYRWILECVTAQVNANKVEAYGRYKVFLEEAQKLKDEWELESPRS